MLTPSLRNHVMTAEERLGKERIGNQAGTDFIGVINNGCALFGAARSARDA